MQGSYHTCSYLYSQAIRMPPNTLHTAVVTVQSRRTGFISTNLLSTNQSAPHFLYCSGHGAVKENWFLDDGSYLAVQAVIELVRRRLAGQGDIGDLLKDLHEAKVCGACVGRCEGKVGQSAGEMAGQGEIGDLLKDLHEAKCEGRVWGSAGEVWRSLRLGCGIHNASATC